MTADIDKISQETLQLLRSALTRRPPPNASALSILNLRTGLGLIPEESLSGEASAPPFAEVGSEDIEVVLQRLKTVEPPAEAEILRVRGVFFDCHLLYPGWWLRSTTEHRLPAGFWTDDAGANTVRNIRHWLNAGFEQWGPSWQFYDPHEPGPYVYGQIGHGDEANSLPVIVSRSIVQRLRGAMGPLHAISAVARGLLYHRSHAVTRLPKALQSALQQMMEAAGGEIPYYLIVDPDLQHKDRKNKPWDVMPSGKRHDIYSAYMWQCLIREQDLAAGNDGTVPLTHTIFVWEHTNLLDPDSIKFNYEALQGKKRYLERELGQKLLMFQQSYPVDQIVGDVPADPLIKPSILSAILARTRARLHEAGPRTD